MANPQILFMNLDLYNLNYVNEIPAIIEKRQFQKSKLIINKNNIVVNNFDDQFSVDNSKSFLNNANWRYQQILYIDENGETYMDGVVTNIIRNHSAGNKTATLEVEDSLSKKLKNKISYTSSSWEDGATIAKNIMDQESFADYDLASITNSISLLQENNCYMKVNIQKSDNLTLLQVLDKLAVYTVSDCYLHNNNIYFRHWYPYTGGAYLTLQEENISDQINISSSITDLINEFSIGYDGDGDTPATDANSNNIGLISRGVDDSNYGTHELEEMRTSSASTSQFVFKDKTSATYIGETYIRKTHKDLDTYPTPLTKIKLDLKYNLQQYITLETYFKLNLSDESWDDKIFQIYEFTRDENKRKLSIVAYEIDV